MLSDILGEIVATLLRIIGGFLFGWLRRPLRFLWRPCRWIFRQLWRPCGWFFQRLGRLYAGHYWLRALGGLVFVNILWLFFCGLSFYFLQSSWRLTYHGEPATGLVVALEERRDSDGVTYSPVVEYDLNGRAYRFNSGIASYPAAYDVGERVPIRYDPVDPRHAEIKAWWSGPPLYILLCAVMLGCAFLTNFVMVRRIWRGESIES